MSWLLLGCLALAQEAPLPAAAPPTGAIAGVVVFPDRAAVTRTVEVALAEGLNEVRFENLPPTLELRSLQAEGRGVAGARILGLDVQSRELAEDRRRRVSELQDRILALRDEVRVQADIVTAANLELGFLAELKAASAKQLSAELLFADKTVAEAEALAAMLRARTPDIQGVVREAQIAQRDLNDQISALQRELSTTSGIAQWSRRDVVVQLESPAAGKAEVDVTYILPGASWRPAYDARADVENNKVELSMNALITQTTGEDWSGVDLVLSTARPAAGVAPPGLDPFWLARPQPVYGLGGLGTRGTGQGGGGYGEAEDMPADDYADVEEERKERAPAAAPPPPPPMVIARAEVEQRAVATTFAVPGASTVPGDGTRRKLRVTDESLEVEFVHVAVPRVEEAAYLVAATTWGAGWPLLGGEVSAFLDGAFVGTSTIATVGTGGDLELAFGQDDAVKIEREVVVDRESSADWMGRISRELSWNLAATNRRKVPVKVELRDRIPVTREARYVVRYRGDEPTEQDAEGQVTFVREVAPGAEATVLFGYLVRYPRKDPPGGVQ